jgi:hypothetical protein
LLPRLRGYGSATSASTQFGGLSAWQSFGMFGALNLSSCPHDVQPLTKSDKVTIAASAKTRIGTVNPLNHTLN